MVEYQAPTSSNNYTWYRLYSDGWVEQGGVFTTTAQRYLTSTINIPIKMNNVNYTCVATTITTANYTGGGAQIKNKTTTNITLCAGTYENSNINTGFNWQVSGISNSGTTQQNRKIIKY